MIKAIFLLYCIVSVVGGQSMKRETADQSEFLFENAKLCGDPFSDPIWIPVLDMCTIECDQTKEYCVENEELQQQCKTLPDECQKLFEQRRSIIDRKKSFVSGVLGTRPSRLSGRPANFKDVVVENSGTAQLTFTRTGDAPEDKQEINFDPEAEFQLDSEPTILEQSVDQSAALRKQRHSSSRYQEDTAVMKNGSFGKSSRLRVKRI